MSLPKGRSRSGSGKTTRLDTHTRSQSMGHRFPMHIGTGSFVRDGQDSMNNCIIGIAAERTELSIDMLIVAIEGRPNSRREEAHLISL